LARCLIIGCGCRGRSLALELRSRGHAVRGTSRDAGRLAQMQSAGVEPVHGDPDRIATIAPAFDHASVTCVLLGSATGGEDELTALHTTRLEMLLTRMLDTTVRGVVYEAAGSVPSEFLEAGARIVDRMCAGSLIPYVLLHHDPADRDEWLAAATDAVGRLLEGP
jgi:uncharacterized protein YbjT (DUF2867 family)